LRTVLVTRDSLTETLTLDGVASALAQEPIAYGWRAAVDDVKVKPSQSVKKGDILVDFNPGDAPKNLDTARGRLQTAQANLVQAQAQADSRQASATQKAAADQQQQQQIILDAELQLKKAQDNLVAVRSGNGAPKIGEMTDLASQETAVASGQAQVARAQAALDKLLAGPDPDAVRVIDREAANAQIALTRAQTDLATLTRGADPESLRTAQNALQRAQTQLQIAQTTKIDPKVDVAVAKMQHDAAIEDAQVAVQSAELQITKLKQPPTGIDVQAARQRVQEAQDALSAAQAKQDAVQAGPDQAAVDNAQAELEFAKHYQAVAQAALDGIKSHPTPAEMADAQDQVHRAQLAVDNARRAPAALGDGGVGSAEIAALEKIVVQNQADVAAAEQTLEDAHLRAPFDGTIVSVRTRPGDLPAPSRPVIIMTRPGPPIVRVDLDDTQLAQLMAGQHASVEVGTDTAVASRADAIVTGVTPPARDGSAGASATLDVSWTDGQAPKFGAQVQVVVNLGQKQGVLVVPKSAIHQAGGRTTVEVQDGTIRRLVTVQVGITTAAAVEIVSGLSEGQVVLAGPA